MPTQPANQAGSWIGYFVEVATTDPSRLRPVRLSAGSTIGHLRTI
jgi:hypothetical protein